MRNAKLLQMFARVWPALMLVTMLGICLFTDTTPQWADPYSISIQDVVFIVILVPYLLLAFFLLPPLIYPQIKDSLNWQIAWFFFAGLTAGIGPVFLYWRRVDRWISEWIRTQKAKESFEKRP